LEPLRVLGRATYNWESAGRFDQLQAEKADGPRPGDDDQVPGQDRRLFDDRVDTTCQGLGEGSRDKVYVVWQAVDLTCIDDTIAGEAAVNGIANDLSLGAHVIIPEATLKAVAAKSGRGLARDAVADLDPFDVLSSRNDHAGELVTHHNRWLDGNLDLVVINVQV
jgi:hypothetical protein